MNESLALLKGCALKNEVTINSSLFSIGRCKTADFIIPHVNVSRNHCQILRAHSLWKICDFSSSGTFVNNKLVGKGESAFLNYGDIIRFGPEESNLSWVFCPVEIKTGDDKGANFINSDKQKNISCDINLKNLRKEAINEKSTISNDSLSENENCCDTEKLKATTKYQNKHNDTIICNLNESKSDSGNEVVNKELEIKLMKQEEEKEALLRKLKEMEEAQQKLFEKLCENQKNKTDSKSESLSDSDLTKNYDQDEVKNSTVNKAQQDLNTVDDKKPGETVLENVADMMETELQCTICSEMFVTAVTLACSHTFCQFCINQWKKKQKTCPICRKKIMNEIRSLVIDNYIDKMIENLSSEFKQRREAIIAERKETIPTKRPRRSKFK